MAFESGSELDRLTGTAHFATPQEIKALLTSPNDTSRLLIGTYGRWRSVGLTHRQQESHVLLCAPAGKGKTSSIILPGLLREDGMRNLVINDVKGELVSKTLGALQQHYTCCLFSPTRVAESHRYNPLCHVHGMEDAENLARCIVENTGTSAEPFWDNAARLLLTATILHLRTSEPQAPLSRIADLLCGMGLDEIVQEMMKSPSQLAHDVAVSFMASLSNNLKQAGSILADMASRLFLLRNPNSATHVVFSGCGQVETDYYSRRIGQTTVPSVSLSHQHALDLDPKATQSTTSRPLIYPDQLRTMKADHLVVLSENLSPVQVKAKSYFKEPHLKRLVNLPATLPSRPVGTTMMDRVSIAETQEEEDKQTLERGDQTNRVEKDPLDGFFLP